MLGTGTTMKYRCMSVAVSDEPPHTCHPTQEDLDSISASGFRCFSCQSHRPRSQFGGYRAGRKLCRFCYPYTDDEEIVGFIAFDKYHGH